MRTIELNIAFGYPVFWNKFKVLRDIVQNFYDALGAERFGKEFRTDYDEVGQRATLSSEGGGFDYRWLIHIGASSKQGKDSGYAGFTVRVSR
jgi:hypothetical protein